jgi:diguanylate cyclase
MASRDANYTQLLAEKALDRIKSLRLPADPISFELWYSYFNGDNPVLNAAIDRELDANASLTIEQLDRLHDKYFSVAQSRNTIAAFGTKISAELDNVIQLLDELIVSSSQSRDDYAEASSRLNNTTDRATITAIVNTVIASLRNVDIRYRALEKRFVKSKDDLEKAQQALAEIAIETKQDALTGLVNRRGFDRAFENAVASSKAHGTSLTLLLIDIDNFKSFNDRYGHLTGDSVLRLVGSALTGCIKGHDTAARYGGEEFTVILPNTTIEGAVALAEQIRTLIGRRKLISRTSGEQLGSITVSIGAAAYRPPERPLEMIERADACLYAAKHAGRNCVRSENDLHGRGVRRD